MSKRRKGYAISGWVNVFKPTGIGSTGVVSIVRGVARAAKAGHAGTLDPEADGILPIALGEATKTIPWVQSGKKTYEVTIAWGRSTTTDDREGETVNESDKRPTVAALCALFPEFTGHIMQRPPQVSAVHVNGQRAYVLARSGEMPELSLRNVNVYDIQLIESSSPSSTSQLMTQTVETSRLRIRTGKGVYIRSLARDFGERLGCFGHVQALTRTCCGNFSQENAILLDDFKALAHKGQDLSVSDVISSLGSALLPISAGLDDIPVCMLTERQACKIASGLAIPRNLASFDPDVGKLGFTPLADTSEFQDKTQFCLVRSQEHDLPVAIARLTDAEIAPVRVFNFPIS